MRARGMTSAYQLAQAMADRASEATAYRLVRSDGKMTNMRAATLEALAVALGVDVPELFERKRR